MTMPPLLEVDRICSVTGSTAPQSSVYCFMNIRCKVLNIGPVTFQKVMGRQIEGVRIGQELGKPANDRGTTVLTKADVNPRSRVGGHRFCGGGWTIEATAYDSCEKWQADARRSPIRRSRRSVRHFESKLEDPGVSKCRGGVRVNDVLQIGLQGEVVGHLTEIGGLESGFRAPRSCAIR